MLLRLNWNIHHTLTILINRIHLHFHDVAPLPGVGVQVSGTSNGVIINSGMKRYHVQALTINSESKHLFWPIPEKELAVNTLLEQNSYWK